MSYFWSSKIKYMQLELPLLPYFDKIDTKYIGEKQYIYGCIRKKYFVWTPEELIRQMMLLYLMEEKQYPARYIRVEMGLKVNGLQKRSDILVFNKALEPILLIECKASKVNINQAVFEQAARYNLTLKVPYLVVTNGPVSYCAQVDIIAETHTFLSEIPYYNQLIG